MSRYLAAERGDTTAIGQHLRISSSLSIAFGGTIGGAQLVLEGEKMRYSISTDAIANVVFTSNTVIVEQFEERTERQTTIRVLS